MIAVAGLLSVVMQTAPAGSCTVEPGGARVTGICTASNSLHIAVAYRSILPVIVLSIGALIMLAVSAVLPKRSWPGLYPLLTAIVGGASAVASAWQWMDLGTRHGHVSHAGVTIGQQVLYDRFSVFFMLLISVAVILGALISDSYLRREGLDGVEGYVLMLMAGVGAMLMCESAGLIMLFLGLEIMSIALYVLAAYHRRRTQSGEAGFKYFILGSFSSAIFLYGVALVYGATGSTQSGEAGFKYFILGSFSSAIFLYGVALVYGATGSTQFGEIATYLARDTLTHGGVLLAGMALLIVGLGFKVAAVPFHFWTPDVYQGSPTPFTGYMAAVAKAAGFAGLIRVLLEGLPTQSVNWRPIIWALAVLTLLVGSVMAIAQRDLKRMLAYSSISQAGYVLVGIQAGTSYGTAGVLFYLFTYTFIIAGSFAVVELIQGAGEVRNDLGAIRGLARRQPYVAAAMLVLLLAQAGVPLTTGFLAKLYVIQASVEQGQYVLAVIAMVSAAIAAFFYLRVALLMYSRPGEAGEIPVPAEAGAVAGAGAAGGAAGGDRSELAGLEPIPSLDGPAATATLEAPVEEAVEVPYLVGLALVICVVFTIAAGVSAPVIDFARHATLLF